MLDPFRSGEPHDCRNAAILKRTLFHFRRIAIGLNPSNLLARLRLKLDRDFWIPEQIDDRLGRWLMTTWCSDPRYEIGTAAGARKGGDAAEFAPEGPMATMAAKAWPSPRLGDQKASKIGTPIGSAMIKDRPPNAVSDAAADCSRSRRWRMKPPI
jgi:hypothetical protein